MSNNKDISLEIKNIFNNNKLDDLKRFLKKRQCLNKSNSVLVYLFHIVQSIGILLTSYATGNNNTNLIWVGVSLNFLATLIHVFQQTNNSFLKKLMADIKSIKDNNYIDEGELVETENNKNINNSLTPSIIVTLNEGETQKVNNTTSVVCKTSDTMHVEAVTVGNPGTGTFIAVIGLY